MVGTAHFPVVPIRKDFSDNKTFSVLYVNQHKGEDYLQEMTAKELRTCAEEQNSNTR